MNAPLTPSPELDLLANLEESEWWDAGRLERAQQRRLQQVVKHAVQTVPFYRGRTHEFEALPVLSRRDLQDHADALLSSDVPPRVGRQYKKRSSGSTGEPVQVVRTDLEQGYWRALSIRDHLWHRRDLAGTLCTIRAVARDRNRSDGETVRKGWGAGTDVLGGDGTMAMISLATDLSR